MTFQQKPPVHPPAAPGGVIEGRDSDLKLIEEACASSRPECGEPATPRAGWKINGHNNQLLWSKRRELPRDWGEHGHPGCLAEKGMHVMDPCPKKNLHPSCTRFSSCAPHH